MKADKHQEVQTVVWVCLFKKGFFLLILILAGITVPVKSQCLRESKIFTNGEQVNFDIYYKWGIIMAKGGTASMTINESSYNNTPAWHTHLLINSTGVVDKAFKIRDTIENYVTKVRPRLLYSAKKTNEGGYYEIDSITYTYKDNQTYVHSLRRNLNRIKVDTTFVGGDCVMDLLGSFLLARSFDWSDLEMGVSYPLEVGMGRHMIKVSYRYEGQQIIERDNVKFRTRLFIADIYDEAFSESKEAIEIWIGDDENHIPIKMRAKLKIGAMEAYYKSSANLRYPLVSRVEIPTQ